MLIEALKYPLNSDTKLKTFMIGSLLTIFSFLIIPLFILIGYFSYTIKHIHERNTNLLQFTNYMELFISGIKLSVILIIYSILIILLPFLIIFPIISNLVLMQGSGIVVLFSILSIFIITFLISYFQLSVIYHYSITQNFKSGFDIKSIINTGNSIKYLIIVLLIMFIVPLLFVIGQVILTLTIIGILLLPPFIFYEIIVCGHLLGQLSK